MILSLCCLILMAGIFIIFAESGSPLVMLSGAAFLFLLSLEQFDLLLFWMPLVLMSAVQLSIPVRRSTYALSVSLLALPMGVMTLFSLTISEDLFPLWNAGSYMPIVCAVLSLMMVGFWAFYRTGGGAYACYCVVSGFLCFQIGALPMLGFMVMAIIGGFCWSYQLKPRTHLVVTSLAMALFIGGVFFKFWWQINSPEVTALRAENPVENLQPRLAYEAPFRVKQRPRYDTFDATDALHDEISMEITFDPDIHPVRRERSLQGLFQTHELTVSEFIKRDGFGFVRMYRPPAPQRKWIDLPEMKPIPFPTPPEIFSADELNHQFIRQNKPAPGEEQLGSVHVDSVVSFVNSPGFGYVNSPQEVVGFQSHGFRDYPTVPGEGYKEAGWEVIRVELVSLLKHDTPRVYLSEHLPRMDELADAPTRPLDQFEAEAIAELREGKNLIIDRQQESLRMVGSLRNIHQCSACHQVKFNFLLGAFTYELRPAVTKKKPKHDPRVSLLVPDRRTFVESNDG